MEAKKVYLCAWCKRPMVLNAPRLMHEDCSAEYVDRLARQTEWEEFQEMYLPATWAAKHKKPPSR